MTCLRAIRRCHICEVGWSALRLRSGRVFAWIIHLNFIVEVSAFQILKHHCRSRSLRVGKSDLGDRFEELGLPDSFPEPIFYDGLPSSFAPSLSRRDFFNYGSSSRAHKRGYLILTPELTACG